GDRLRDGFSRAFRRIAAGREIIFQLANTILDLFDRLVDIGPLRLQLFKLLLTFRQGEGELRPAAAFGGVHVQHLLESLQAVAEPAPAQDYLETPEVLA